jgi:hypothetical protein
MHPFSIWLDRVLTHGESVQDDPPEVTAGERPAAVELLRVAFDRTALDVAGPPIPFNARAALCAAELLARACWLLVGADPEEAASVRLNAEPSTPAAHLSADVTLRLLPAVHRRATSRDPGGRLATELERVLRRWPLAGVLADLDGEPITEPDLAGHPGLQLLYAERLVRTGRPGWVPKAGPAREWSERVFEEQGKPLPATLPQEQPRA